MAEYREFQDGELIAGTRYQVQRLIGVGGMGTVYEVEHIELGKRFVLKALLRELSRREDLVIRLRNEWRALGRLEHPSIVTVTDAGTSATGVPFYVMERLEGETLAQRMRRTRRFPLKEAVDIAAGVLEGLAAAHQIGVVHRDVKPPNIFLVGEGKPKVLDFGVAKIADDPGVVTARGIAVGTPRYMSPEQARGEKVDGRADVYSTGLILFEMITGVSPFEEARDANELILAHLVRRAPVLSSLAGGVPPELDAACACMLAKVRDDRPPSALDAARRLREIAAQLAPIGEPRFPSYPPAEPRFSSYPPAEARLSTPPSSTPDEATAVPVENGHHTTRPDGVASRRSTLTSGSMSDGMLGGTFPAGPPASSPPQPFARSFLPDTPFAPPSFAVAAPHPAPISQRSSDARVRTEMLTAHPAAAPTRTRHPSPTLSETPPPVTPTPDAAAFRPRSRNVAFVLTAAAVIGVIFGVAFLVVRGAITPPKPADIAKGAPPSAPADNARAAAQSGNPAEAEVHALRPATPAEEAVGRAPTQPAKSTLTAPAAAPSPGSMGPSGDGAAERGVDRAPRRTAGARSGASAQPNSAAATSPAASPPAAPPSGASPRQAGPAAKDPSNIAPGLSLPGSGL